MHHQQCTTLEPPAASAKPLVHVFVDQNNFYHVGRDLRAKLTGLDAQLRLYAFELKENRSGAVKNHIATGFNVARYAPCRPRIACDFVVELMMAAETSMLADFDGKPVSPIGSRILLISQSSTAGTLAENLRLDGVLAHRITSVTDGLKGAARALQVEFTEWDQ